LPSSNHGVESELADNIPIFLGFAKWNIAIGEMGERIKNKREGPPPEGERRREHKKGAPKSALLD
jgi:hypothetical protein